MLEVITTLKTIFIKSKTNNDKDNFSGFIESSITNFVTFRGFEMRNTAETDKQGPPLSDSSSALCPVRTEPVPQLSDSSSALCTVRTEQNPHCYSNSDSGLSSLSGNESLKLTTSVIFKRLSTCIDDIGIV